MPELIGPTAGAGLRVAVIVSRFNRGVTAALLDGALEALRKEGVADGDVDVLHVPGAFEITLAAELAAASGRYDTLVCLGAVVRGETPHFDYICQEVSRGVGEVARVHRLPVAFGILTTETMEQALARAGSGHGNKGFEAAMTALEMVGLQRSLAGADASSRP